MGARAGISKSPSTERVVQDLEGLDRFPWEGLEQVGDIQILSILWERGVLRGLPQKAEA